MANWLQRMFTLPKRKNSLKEILGKEAHRGLVRSWLANRALVLPEKEREKAIKAVTALVRKVVGDFPSETSMQVVALVEAHIRDHVLAEFSNQVDSQP